MLPWSRNNDVGIGASSLQNKPCISNSPELIMQVKWPVLFSFSFSLLFDMYVCIASNSSFRHRICSYVVVPQ